MSDNPLKVKIYEPAPGFKSISLSREGEAEKLPSKYGVHSEEYVPIRTNASSEVYEEVGCVSSNGSTRRADIIIIDRQKDKGVIPDPTIRFEMHEQQPQEVL
ncbi:hypothetical protein ANN_13961 [Periplaneta americana]|uniref:Uncharacterized protein n=1 Tax=Periplaneta americana TaxID=6978 RepID=A0ABQ8SWH1_PERAM|nr:hypothetical protein ANN_13961 [Periplaneta americana]